DARLVCALEQRSHPRSAVSPYTTLFRSLIPGTGEFEGQQVCAIHSKPVEVLKETNYFFRMSDFEKPLLDLYESNPDLVQPESVRDRKSTRLNSSHVKISYAVFCLKKTNN